MNRNILTFILMMISIIGFSQEKIYINFSDFKKGDAGYKEAKQNIKKGNTYFKKMTTVGYLKSLEYYLKANKYNSNNAELNYKIGIAYLESIEQDKALSYLQKAQKLNPEVSTFISWNLGRAYHENYLFDKAIVEYTKFKKIMTEYGAPTKKIKRKIQECKNGKKLAMSPTDAMIIKINSINSKYPEYCPLISADESMMIFTARKDENVGGKKAKDGLAYEDIYVAYRKNGKWGKPQNIGYPLNTAEHDATVGLSADGQTMFLYHNLDIYVSELNGDKWSKPKPLPPTINTEESVENSACISFDGKTLYFIRGKTADPDKSNSDIYMSKKRNGKWGRAKKLSSVVNTKYDEDGVFIHPDGKTLYFSSKGHNTMGGFDIFKTVRQDNGTWSKPENLGLPVNTPDDDLYYVMAANGEHGYYSSIKDIGSGAMDIYKIDYPVKYEITVDSVKKKKNNYYLTILKGKVTNGITGKPLEASIEIFDTKADKNVSTSNSNSSTGKYLVSLPSGKNYGMQVTKKGYLFHSENFNIQKTEGYKEVIINIKLYPFKKDVKVILKNIFFDTDKYILRPESSAELNRLTKILKENPTLKIEISGHTDNKGNYKHNVTLSKNRAAAVVTYLVSKGIPQDRLTSRGASWDEAIATNKTKEGRQLNRRVEFKIMNN